MTLPAARLPLRLILAAAYFAAGVLHLAYPGPFLGITPGRVPWPQAVLAATGVAEIAGAVALALALLLAALPGGPASLPEEAPEQQLALVEYFTATWCPPCVQGGLALEAVADMDDVVVLAYHPLEDDPFGSPASTGWGR